MSSKILTVKCPDKMGIVSTLSGFLASNGAFIVEANHHNDEETGLAFLRFAFSEENPLSIETWSECAASVAKLCEAEMQFYNANQPMKVVIAVSKFGHCLQELIHRWKSGALPIDIQAIVSNHKDMQSFTEWADIPYHYLPVSNKNKAEQEQKIRDIVSETKSELLVLARYMQILSPEMCRDFDGKAINIHHSFLPSFKGARPYSQAHAKGVKIIGATAHYVTTDLDEGPIIEQAVERVDHSASVTEFMNLGRDTESIALTRAVRWHAERRVQLAGKRTIIFK